MLSALLAHGHDIRSSGLPRDVGALHCAAVAAGYEQRRAEVYSWDGMRRGTQPFLVIQHSVLGEGRLEYEGVRYRLRPGQCMLVTMPHAHRYWLERGGEWEYFWLLLSGREALRLAREVLAVAGPVLEPEAAVVERLAGACFSLLTTPGLTAGEVSALGYGAMAALADAAFGGRAAPGLAPGMARVVAHVEAHLGEALTVERLAAVAGLSRAHFVRVFAAALGMPPSDFVRARRLERVERLLLATEMGVGEIARATGFADGNYLAKVLRRERGVAPLELRATRAGAV